MRVACVAAAAVAVGVWRRMRAAVATRGRRARANIIVEFLSNYWWFDDERN